jgi:NAD+ synthase (glutamine-hydrolysing)
VDYAMLSRAPIRAADPDPITQIHEALILGLRDYMAKCGFTQAVLGLSGGIDSAVVAALAAEALGPKNVHALIMPSPYSSEASALDALTLAKTLGITTTTLDIAEAYHTLRTLTGRSPDTDPDLADENLQARIRGTLLMTYSNRHGAMVLSTGNKSELAVGYCTLYGDMAGGLALISDLPKTHVYELAHWINHEREVIPDAILTKAPSAELKPDQCDQDALPPYAQLDAILLAYIEDHQSMDEIVAQGHDRAVVERIIELIHRNEYKRAQAAPGIKVSPKAFGIGRRFPIASKF